MYISLLLKMINGFSWPAKIKASPFNLLNNNTTVVHDKTKLGMICWVRNHAQEYYLYVKLSFNGSQLAKMKKEYSWHVPAIKFIGMKQLV